MTLRLLVYSDLHLEFAPFTVPRDLDYDIAVLAGDIAAPGGEAVRWAQRRDTFGRRPVVLVPGNHEFYGSRRDAELERARALAHGSNVHLLDRDAVVLGGTRFLGATLWTDFDLDTGARHADRASAMRFARRHLPDYTGAIFEGDPPRPLTPGLTRREHLRSRRWLARQLGQPHPGPTVVVTHHAPSPRSLDPAYAGSPLNACFASALEPGIFRGVSLWVHGHLHCSHDWQQAEHGTRVRCNPRGLVDARGRAENPGFEPRCVIALAAARARDAMPGATRPRG